MRVHVEMPEELDVDGRARAHARDEIPDRTPCGLRHLADAGDVGLTFRRPLREPRLAVLARRVRIRLGPTEVVAGADPERARATGLAARRRLEENRTTAHMAARVRAVLDRTVELGVPGRRGR